MSLNTPNQLINYLNRHGNNYDPAFARAFLKVYNASSQANKNRLEQKVYVDVMRELLEVANRHQFFANLYPKLLRVGLDPGPAPWKLPKVHHIEEYEEISAPRGKVKYGNTIGRVGYNNNGKMRLDINNNINNRNFYSYHKYGPNRLFQKEKSNYKSFVRRFDTAMNGHNYKIYGSRGNRLNKQSLLRSKYGTLNRYIKSMKPNAKLARAKRTVRSYIPRIKQGIRKRKMHLQLKHMPPVAGFPGGSEYRKALENYNQPVRSFRN